MIQFLGETCEAVATNESPSLDFPEDSPSLPWLWRELSYTKVTRGGRHSAVGMMDDGHGQMGQGQLCLLS